MKVFKVATAALLIAGAASSLSAQSVGHPLSLTREERAAIVALQAAAAGQDRAAQDAALAAARAAARGPDARYAIAHYEIEIGRARGDAVMQNQAIDSMVDGGLATPEELGSALASQTSRAYGARDLARAERLLARAVETQPGNAQALIDYAQFKSRNRNPLSAAADRALAVSLFQRALLANQAAGRASPESLHRRALAIAYDGTQRINGVAPIAPQVAPQAIAFGRELVAAYPTTANWRDATLVYRELAPTDPALALDIRRLMRAAGAIAGEREFADFANALNSAGLAAEAKAVLEDGIARGEVDATKPAVAALIASTTRRTTADRAGLTALRTRAAAGTAAQATAAGDVSFGFGQYTEAAALYQAALLKGPEDPNLVNSRLGAALALAGRQAEAEAALRAVTGPRADLAGFWLVWLAHRPA